MKISTHLWGSPFDWNRTQRKLVVTPKTKLHFQFYAVSIFLATVYVGCMIFKIKILGDTTNLGFVVATFGTALIDILFCFGLLLDPAYCADVFNAILIFGVSS